VRLLAANTQIRLLERKRDLILGELALHHDMLLAPGPSIMPVVSVTKLFEILGRGQPSWTKSWTRVTTRPCVNGDSATTALSAFRGPIEELSQRETGV
jgi:hypothetical protein